MKKTSLLLGALLCATLVGCGNNSSTSTSSQEREKLIVGLECNYAPFNWTENERTDSNYEISGTVTYAEGYDVQIAKMIADELDMELVIKKLEWDALIPSVQEYTIDLIIAGMSPTETRKVDIDFTSPYYSSEHVLLVESSSTYANVTSVTVCGIRKHDLAVRLKYAEFENIEIGEITKENLNNISHKNGEVCYMLINYTALFDTQNILKALEDK